MAEYQVIARKWRPMRFADVVGQEHLTRTLRNAIMQNRTAHAYLLVGSRGIGKTTTARILAKALNCLHPEDGEPCCKCESCLAIANNSSLDIIEIDAASQNSVSDVRALREQAQFAPVHSKYKIYIVDEVHMLSTAAWNAFLKILEEPPPHVKFIFATTEVHRVLPTIISRCQRFDLRRIPTNLIVERLAYIADAEKIPVSRAALEAIARSADGGMRDAQSLLDQVITFFSDSKETIDEKQIFSLFGLTSPEEIDALITALLHDNRPAVIHALYALSSQGRNLETLLDELIEQLRAILVAGTVPEAAVILETSNEHIAHLRELGTGVPPAKIQSILESLTPMGYALRNALNKQVFLETALLKAMREAFTVRLDDVLAQLQKVREKGELEAIEQLKVSAFQLPIQVSSVAIPTAPQSIAPTKEITATPLTATEETTEKKTVKIIDTPVVVHEAEELRKTEPIIEQETVEKVVAETQPECIEPIVDDVKIEDIPEAIIEPAEIVEETPEPIEVEVNADSENTHTDDAIMIEDVEISPMHPKELNQWPFVDTPVADPAITEFNSEEVFQNSTEINDEVPPEIHDETPTENIEEILDDTYPDETTDWSAEKLWDALKNDVREHIQNPTLVTVMSEAIPENIVDKTLYISFDEEYENEQAGAVRKSSNVLANCLKRITHNRVNQLSIAIIPGLHSIDEQRFKSKNLDQEVLRLKTRPYIQKALDLFGGDIVDIH